MMTAGGDYMTDIETSLVEKHQVIDANQGHTTIYASPPIHQSWSFPPNSAAPSQNPYKMATGLTENGNRLNSGYNFDQYRDTTMLGEASNGTSTTPHAPPTSLGAPSTQDYSGYANYPYSTNSYAYGNSEHQSQYYSYQQPATDSSHQQLGASQNTGAPYQSLSSFQNASSYVGPTSYSSTYYNPGDYQTTSSYQTAAGYQGSSYNNQSNLWNGGSVGSHPPYDYSNYTQSDSKATHNAYAASGNPNHYHQQYSHWGGYYSQTTSSNVPCAPGTENLSVTHHSTVQNPGLSSTCGHPYANNQPPPPGTTSWRQDFASSALPTSNHPGHGKKENEGYNQIGGRKAGEHGYQNQFQTPLDSSQLSHGLSEDQQKAVYSQNPHLQFPFTNQVSQNFQTQTSSLDTCHTNKMQIPTNPRIATNLVVGSQKAEKESITTGSALKPAYVSVAAPKLNNKEATHNSADNMIKGTFPPSLRAYVERTFARCKDDSQRAANQNIMKEMITKASADGSLFTRNWDVEPFFPLPNTMLGNSDNIQNSSSLSPFPKQKSPSRRTKSRWEPLPEEKLAERLQSVNPTSIPDVAWDLSKHNKNGAKSADNDVKENCWNKLKFVPAQQQPQAANNTTRPLKKQRFGDSYSAENCDASSDSDKDQSLTKYYSSVITLANSPEERKKREHRVKRFEKGQSRQSQTCRVEAAGAGTLYTRRNGALFLAKNSKETVNRAVEDIDWDSLTVKGTCQEIEKRYLRLTSAPDPSTVRTEEVLEKALLMVQSSHKNYLFKCDQLKSIRQDLTVQRIQNELTVKVYETHARSALEAGDLAEYNQCQSQLKSLYYEGIQGCQLEFFAYNLLCVILHSSNNRELLSSMARLSAKAKEDEAVKHALAVRAAVTSGNYILFFRLYQKAPNLNRCLMDLYVEKMRFEAVRCMCKSCRPTIPISYISQVLGFSKMFLPEDGNGIDGLEECEDWLRTHGAVLSADNNGEMQLDSKASSSTLFMPEPEDAVAHGDTSLAVDDFLTRTS